MVRYGLATAATIVVGLALSAAEPASRPAPASAPASGPATTRAAIDPRTAPLAAAIGDWVSLIEKDDLKTAAARWCDGTGASEAMEQNWSRLKNVHKQHDYRNWVERAKEVGDARAFKVGGHAVGHLHVDWAKTDDGWRIAKVTVCR